MAVADPPTREPQTRPSDAELIDRAARRGEWAAHSLAAAQADLALVAESLLAQRAGESAEAVATLAMDIAARRTAAT